MEEKLRQFGGCVNDLIMGKSMSRTQAKEMFRQVLLNEQPDLQQGAFLAAVAREIRETGSPVRPPCAVIAGGETVVHLRGSGRGGRNQELALAAAPGIADLADTLIFSVGSDGTDGPTDAAGAMVTGAFCRDCLQKGLSIEAHLNNNDSYAIHSAMNSLIVTGPTGTNVNDLTVILCK
jgi:hydroxypyruvate reductase